MGMIIPMTPIRTMRMTIRTVTSTTTPMIMTMTTNMGTAIVMTPSLDTIATMRTILTMTMTMSSIMIMPVWNPSLRATIIRS